MCSRPLTLCPRDRVVYWQKQGLVELVRGAVDALGLWRDCNFFYVTGCVCVLSYFSRVWLFVTPVACQAPLSMGFSRQEYWSGLPCPPPGDLPDPGIEPMSLMSPALAGGFFQANAGLPCYLKPGYSFKRVSRVQKNKNKKAGVSIWSRKNRASGERLSWLTYPNNWHRQSKAGGSCSVFTGLETGLSTPSSSLRPLHSHPYHPT